jgi:chromosome partitioning protein
MITVIANLKGGTGKSTVTFNLAVWLSSMGKEPLVVDLDPQRTLSDVAALRAEENVATHIEVLSGAFPDVGLLEEAVEVLVDVGTADLDAFRRALVIADRVLIPVTPSQADIWSTQRFVQFLYKVTEGDAPESIAFINRADVNRAIPASDEAAAALTSLPGIRLISQRVSDRPVFRDSFSEGLAVFELEPRSKAAAEFVALATALFGEKRSFGRRRPRTGRARAAAIAMQREVLADLYGNGGHADRDSPADRADMDGQTSDAAGQHWADETERGAKGKKKHKGGKKRLKEHKTKHKGSGKKGKKDKEGKKGKKAKKNKKGKRC